MTSDWINREESCSPRDLPEPFKLAVIFCHLLGYPAIFYGICTLFTRSSDFYHFGNFKLTILAFFCQLATIDYFISDHINDAWYVEYETNVIHCIGNVCVVGGNAFISLSLYPTKRGNLEPTKTYLLNALLVILLFVEPYFYFKMRLVALVILIVAGIIAGHRMLNTFGGSVKYYAIGYMAAGAVGGTCTIILVFSCIQVIHLFEATLFAVAAFMFALVLRHFDANYNNNSNNGSDDDSDGNGNGKSGHRRVTSTSKLGRLMEDSSSSNGNDSGDANFTAIQMNEPAV